MRRKRKGFLLLLVVIIAIETSYLVAKSTKSHFFKKSHCAGFDIQKRLSEEYLNYGLYEQAVDAYEKCLFNRKLDANKRANISYIIGNIYMDNLTDYGNALASYVRAKTFSPSTPNISEINKKLIMCLERLGKSLDAERELAKVTELKPQEEVKEGEVIVAKIGDRNITMTELEREIEKLPPFLKDNYKEQDKKIEFLNQYITGELLYDSAKKRGYDKEKDVIEAVHQAQKQVMIEKLVMEDITTKIEEPTAMDLDLYYNAHKDDYVEETKDEEGNVEKRQRSFDEVKDIVRLQYINEKRQEKLQNFINNQLKAKKVEIYDGVF